jgi:ABC-2 type transport system permease protein
VNAVIVRITLREMVGRKRVLLLLALPVTILLLAAVIRVTVHPENVRVAAGLLQIYGLGTLLPLVALIASTGVLGPEIDDGTIVFLLAKPIPRPVIVHSKLVVAVGLTIVFAAIPELIAGLIMVGTDQTLAVAFGIAAAAGAVAYCAIFVLINVVSRHAVVIGLLYALLWEGLIGSFVPGARQLSVQQWALSIAHAISGGDVLSADVAPLAAIPLLVATAVLATALAGQRLRSLSIAGED